MPSFISIQPNPLTTEEKHFTTKRHPLKFPILKIAHLLGPDSKQHPPNINNPDETSDSASKKSPRERKQQEKGGGGGGETP